MRKFWPVWDRVKSERDLRGMSGASPRLGSGSVNQVSKVGANPMERSMDAGGSFRAWAILAGLMISGGGAAAEKAAFFVENASSVTDGCLDVGTRELQFSCHRIQSGAGAVVAFRLYKRSWKTDGARFRKLTVHFPANLKAGDRFSLGEGVARGFFSRGSSAFAGKRGCYGRAESGEVEVLSMTKKMIAIRVSAPIPMSSPLAFPKECTGAEDVDLVIRAVPAQLDGLGAWEGRPGADDSPYDEANIMK